MRETEDIWTVELRECHPEYQTVHLRRPNGYENYDVVMVDAKKLMHYTTIVDSSYVLPPVIHWSTRDKRAYFEFLKPPGAVYMPTVSFSEDEYVVIDSRRPLFKTKKVVRTYTVSYGNGRHRARYLHDAGAIAFPVLCPGGQSDALRRLCGYPSESDESIEPLDLMDSNSDIEASTVFRRLAVLKRR